MEAGVFRAIPGGLGFGLPGQGEVEGFVAKEAAAVGAGEVEVAVGDERRGLEDGVFAVEDEEAVERSVGDADGDGAAVEVGSDGLGEEVGGGAGVVDFAQGDVSATGESHEAEFHVVQRVFVGVGEPSDMRLR